MFGGRDCLFDFNENDWVRRTRDRDFNECGDVGKIFCSKKRMDIAFDLISKGAININYFLFQKMLGSKFAKDYFTIDILFSKIFVKLNRNNTEISKIKSAMNKNIFLIIVLSLFGLQKSIGCDCAPLPSFCESVYYENEIIPDYIVRGTVMRNDSNGREIKITHLLFGDLNEKEILISSGQCDYFTTSFELNGDYIIAINKYQGNYYLLECAISILRIENEVVRGQIAPGVNRMDYNDFLNSNNCGPVFFPISITQSLELYPNPTNKEIRLSSTSSEFSMDNLKLRIFDAVGREVDFQIYDESFVVNEEWVIDIEHFVAGLYFVLVSNDVQTVSYKIVKV